MAKYSIQGKNGFPFESMDQYETFEEAQEALNILSQTLTNVDFEIVEVKAGRPALGITKKVSITLPEEYWNFIEDVHGRNKSKFMREVLIDYLDQWLKHYDSKKDN